MTNLPTLKGISYSLNVRWVIMSIVFQSSDSSALLILFGALPRSPTKLMPPSTVCCRCWLLRTHICTHLPRSALGRPGEGAQSRWLMGMALGGGCVCQFLWCSWGSGASHGIRLGLHSYSGTASLPGFFPRHILPPSHLCKFLLRACLREKGVLSFGPCF